MNDIDRLLIDNWKNSDLWENIPQWMDINAWVDNQIKIFETANLQVSFDVVSRILSIENVFKDISEDKLHRFFVLIAEDSRTSSDIVQSLHARACQIKSPEKRGEVLASIFSSLTPELKEKSFYYFLKHIASDSNPPSSTVKNVLLALYDGARGNCKRISDIWKVAKITLDENIELSYETDLVNIPPHKRYGTITKQLKSDNANLDDVLLFTGLGGMLHKGPQNRMFHDIAQSPQLTTEHLYAVFQFDGIPKADRFDVVKRLIQSDNADIKQILEFLSSKLFPAEDFLEKDQRDRLFLEIAGDQRSIVTDEHRNVILTMIQILGDQSPEIYGATLVALSQHSDFFSANLHDFLSCVEDDRLKKHHVSAIVNAIHNSPGIPLQYLTRLYVVVGKRDLSIDVVNEDNFLNITQNPEATPEQLQQVVKLTFRDINRLTNPETILINAIQNDGSDAMSVVSNIIVPVFKLDSNEEPLFDEETRGKILHAVLERRWETEEDRLGFSMILVMLSELPDEDINRVIQNINYLIAIDRIDRVGMFDQLMSVHKSLTTRQLRTMAEKVFEDYAFDNNPLDQDNDGAVRDFFSAITKRQEADIALRSEILAYMRSNRPNEHWGRFNLLDNLAKYDDASPEQIKKIECLLLTEKNTTFNPIAPALLRSAYSTNISFTTLAKTFSLDDSTFSLMHAEINDDNDKNLKDGAVTKLLHFFRLSAGLYTKRMYDDSGKKDYRVISLGNLAKDPLTTGEELRQIFDAFKAMEWCTPMETTFLLTAIARASNATTTLLGDILQDTINSDRLNDADKNTIFSAIGGSRNASAEQVDEVFPRVDIDLLDQEDQALFLIGVAENRRIISRDYLDKVKSYNTSNPIPDLLYRARFQYAIKRPSLEAENEDTEHSPQTDLQIDAAIDNDQQSEIGFLSALPIELRINILEETALEETRLLQYVDKGTQKIFELNRGTIYKNLIAALPYERRFDQLITFIKPESTTPAQLSAVIENIRIDTFSQPYEVARLLAIVVSHKQAKQNHIQSVFEKFILPNGEINIEMFPNKQDRSVVLAALTRSKHLSTDNIDKLLKHLDSKNVLLSWDHAGILSNIYRHENATDEQRNVIRNLVEKLEFPVASLLPMRTAMACRSGEFQDLIVLLDSVDTEAEKLEVVAAVAMDDKVSNNHITSLIRYINSDNFPNPTYRLGALQSVASRFPLDDENFYALINYSPNDTIPDTSPFNQSTRSLVSFVFQTFALDPNTPSERLTAMLQRIQENQDIMKWPMEPFFAIHFHPNGTQEHKNFIAQYYRDNLEDGITFFNRLATHPLAKAADLTGVIDWYKTCDGLVLSNSSADFLKKNIDKRLRLFNVVIENPHVTLDNLHDIFKQLLHTDWELIHKTDSYKTYDLERLMDKITEHKQVNSSEIGRFLKEIKTYQEEHPNVVSINKIYKILMRSEKIIDDHLVAMFDDLLRGNIKNPSNYEPTYSVYYRTFTKHKKATQVTFTKYIDCHQEFAKNAASELDLKRSAEFIRNVNEAGETNTSQKISLFDQCMKRNVLEDVSSRPDINALTGTRYYRYEGEKDDLDRYLKRYGEIEKDVPDSRAKACFLLNIVSDWDALDDHREMVFRLFVKGSLPKGEERTKLADTFSEIFSKRDTPPAFVEHFEEYVQSNEELSTFLEFFEKYAPSLNETQSASFLEKIAVHPDAQEDHLQRVFDLCMNTSLRAKDSKNIIRGIINRSPNMFAYANSYVANHDAVNDTDKQIAINVDRLKKHLAATRKSVTEQSDAVAGVVVELLNSLLKEKANQKKAKAIEQSDAAIDVTVEVQQPLPEEKADQKNAKKIESLIMNFMRELSTKPLAFTAAARFQPSADGQQEISGISMTHLGKLVTAHCLKEGKKDIRYFFNSQSSYEKKADKKNPLIFLDYSKDQTKAYFADTSNARSTAVVGVDIPASSAREFGDLISGQPYKLFDGTDKIQPAHALGIKAERDAISMKYAIALRERSAALKLVEQIKDTLAHTQEDEFKAIKTLIKNFESPKTHLSIAKFSPTLSSEKTLPAIGETRLAELVTMCHVKYWQKKEKELTFSFHTEATYKNNTASNATFLDYSEDKKQGYFAMPAGNNAIRVIEINIPPPQKAQVTNLVSGQTYNLFSLGPKSGNVKIDQQITAIKEPLLQKGKGRGTGK